MNMKEKDYDKMTLQELRELSDELQDQYGDDWQPAYHEIQQSDLEDK